MKKAPMTGKRCYEHLGGKLGSTLFLFYLEKGWIEQEEGKETSYRLTETGRAAFAQMGLEFDPADV